MWYNFRQNVVIIDCEMSGTDPDNNQLLEIAALNCDPKNLSVISSFHTYVGPNTNENIYDVLYKANPHSLLKNNLHKKKSILSNAPTPKQAVRDLLKWVPESYILVGYNLSLDILFLKSQIPNNRDKKRLTYKIIDVSSLVELYRATNPNIILDWSLTGACRALGIECPEAHAATSDCELTRQLFGKILQLLEIKKC